MDTELTGASAASTSPARVKKAEQGKSDLGKSSVPAAEGGSDEQPEPNVDRLQLDPQLEPQIATRGPAQPSETAGSFKRPLSKQPKGVVPSFMGTTAAEAAKSRPSVLKPEAVTKTKMTAHARIPILTATRADLRAVEQAATRAGT